MAGRKRATEAEAYESDDGFVEDAPKSKKSKTAASEVKKREGKEQVNLDKQTDDEGNPFWEVSKLRRVTVSEFKGKSMVGIREYYEKDGKTLPGKKGISMPVDQFAALVSLLPEIDKALAAKGVELPRPLYDAVSNGGAAGKVDDAEDEPANEGDEAEDDEKPKRANYEATDDEDE
ncbi:hypothetical protein LTS18_005240 [Coniosporium uncinatum]|uniref:Uncharacterized protein n=1 Tax=Coniosporium uncinatum TaxID=93489 RepID=A0ACC3D4Y4_9PEZI|nr:hypothetical protein LTS18_005240 [Coniosporium uncinatum]